MNLLWPGACNRSLGPARTAGRARPRPVVAAALSAPRQTAATGEE
ncbi:hypothetical protein YW3DRAFT_04451 [Streptomyces sp. MnatMP-M77]|nr:hypothetical protein YW3DRAFT_04451 [Streptomyces sp. MnatMP-M77]